MPVHFDDYDPGRADAGLPTPGSNGHRILTFLLNHPETGFSPSEIAAGTDVSRGSVGPTLQRLERRGLVRHKEPYWAVANDDRLATLEAMLAGLQSIASSGDDGWADVDATAYTVDAAEVAKWRMASE